MSYRASIEFTAQGKTVSALLAMYKKFEGFGDIPKTEYLPIVVFMAFSIEAYINNVGSRKMPKIWDKIERIPWRDKMEILHRNAGKSTNWGVDPLQFAASIFRLRDKLSHGKPERVEGPEFASFQEAQGHAMSLEPDWYQQLSREWMKDAGVKYVLLMHHIGGLYGLDAWDFRRASEFVVVGAPGE